MVLGVPVSVFIFRHVILGTDATNGAAQPEPCPAAADKPGRGEHHHGRLLRAVFSAGGCCPPARRAAAWNRRGGRVLSGNREARLGRGGPAAVSAGRSGLSGLLLALALCFLAAPAAAGLEEGKQGLSRGAITPRPCRNFYPWPKPVTVPCKTRWRPCITPARARIRISTRRRSGSARQPKRAALDAQYCLGQACIITVKGVPQQFPEAATWLTEAALTGKGGAQYLLAVLYCTAGRVVKIPVKGHFWALLAAQSEDIADEDKRRPPSPARPDPGHAPAKQIASIQAMVRDMGPQAETVAGGKRMVCGGKGGRAFPGRVVLALGARDAAQNLGGRARIGRRTDGRDHGQAAYARVHDRSRVVGRDAPPMATTGTPRPGPAWWPGPKSPGARRHPFWSRWRRPVRPRDSPPACPGRPGLRPLP